MTMVKAAALRQVLEIPRRAKVQVKKTIKSS
jgi:hypothetical protein